ncbi:o-succinylbenzoate synthase [Hymenobacter qilianensis]|uniref:O-succinylbenzoate synthase n=2 Tax=Hymenobacter qilianensis TaxID=1385715 RepID=A0A7H0GS71_9BACT|nr:o-succinylbenzoate synthase [Hymenobacter qilianensis]QNP51137.1 o-succinylbenzoate synthase [Hymenobacter qilianensis]GGF78011.1 o-succinylbenzoate synthase [Hymenobacter qilianensis]
MLHLTYCQRALRFNFPARTSRGALTEHVAYYLLLRDSAQPEHLGIGDAAPLAGLSPDFGLAFEPRVAALCAAFNRCQLPDLPPSATNELVDELVEPTWPALRFALETALLDWQHGGRRQLFDNAFSRGEAGIPINGLVWMGEAAFMQTQIQKKLADGYSCLKMKIGGIDFATELQLLAEIRAVAGPEQLTLRVDANGAFAPHEALSKLEQLARFDLHSIEQPIAAGQPALMADLCRQSPVPIALDEELIGVTRPEQQHALLAQIQPAYIIIKPTLVGGLHATRQWLRTAEAHNADWWLTSALESNVGLNAVSQLAGEYVRPDFPQGLGTGQLYHNNVAAPLRIASGHLHYDPAGEWEIPC